MHSVVEQNLYGAQTLKRTEETQGRPDVQRQVTLRGSSVGQRTEVSRPANVSRPSAFFPRRPRRPHRREQVAAPSGLWYRLRHSWRRP